MVSKETTRKLSETVKSFLSKTTEEYKLSNLSWEGEDCQDTISVDDIKDGLVFTSDGRILSLVEIIPINFANMTPEDQVYTADKFGDAFHSMPEKGQFKIMSINTNLDAFEKRVRDANIGNLSPEYAERIDNYMSLMRLYQSTNSVSRRFFYIHEYVGEDGKKTANYEDIKRTMRQQQKDTVNALRGMGNVVLDLQMDDMAIAEVFYLFYNPNSSANETLEQRTGKVCATANWFGQSPSLRDLIAPRGIRFGRWDFCVMDGIYHTYLVLKRTSFPEQVPAAWTVVITNNNIGGDIDFFYDKVTSDLNDFVIDRTDLIHRGVAGTYDSDNDKGVDNLNKAANARNIKEARKNGEDLYDVCMIVTLRAKTFEDLYSKRISFLKAMKTNGLYFETCYAKTNDFLSSVTPLAHCDHTIFKNHKRNMLNSSLASLYPFVSYEMFDQNGVWLGTSSNGTMFGIDNFNKKRFSNPHISIFGKSGSGKSVTELALLSRLRMNGVRVMCLLPLKGHEYKEAVESLGGEYICLYSTEVCINVCEIRPVEILNEENCKDDEERMEALKNSESLLSLKVEFLINWIRIQLDVGDRISTEEKGELNTLLVRLYNSFGITDNNISIFKKDENGFLTNELVTMPVIEDIYNALLDSPRLKRFASILNPWVNGSLKHMNGQTNVKLDSMVTAIDVNEDRLGNNLPAFMLIGFEYFYSVGRRDLDEKCAIVLDETWKFLVNKECSAYIFKMEKILRSYSTSLICATQQIADCMRNEDAKSLVTMPDIKIILKTEKFELPLLEQSITLSPYEEKEIQDFSQGDCFFCLGSEKIKMHVQVSVLELYLYDPREKEKQKYLRMIQNGAV